MTLVSEKLLETLEFDSIREIVEGYCRSPLGKTVARRMGPYDTLEKALRALDQVMEMEACLADGPTLSFSGARDAMHLIEQALEKNRSIDPQGLCDICSLLTCARELGARLRGSAQDKIELQSLLSKMPEMEDHEARLGRTVDAGGNVLSSASPRLAAVREKKERLTAEIRRRAESFLSSREPGRYLQEAHIHIRNGRMVLPVRVEQRNRVKGILHGYSASGNTVFIEPQALVEDQNLLEKKKNQEAREIDRILWERTRELIDAREEIETLQRIVAWLDFTHGRALFKGEYGFKVPRLTEEPVLKVPGARHPLLFALVFKGTDGEADARREAALKAVVPLDLHLGTRFDILVITGPNTGGKTAALKTAGLLCLMAAAGLPVPAAEGAIIPYYTRLLADIGDEQDLTRNLSTFSSHMQRISEIIEKADDRSLVLLDELGTGTDPLEGEALGRAILNYLLRSGAKVLVSTHLSMLKEFAFSSPRVENACMEFNPDTLAPTFHLKIGMPGESNAIRIARRLGLPAFILEEAETVLARAGSEGREQLKHLMDAVQRVRLQTEQTLGESRKEAEEAMRLKKEAAAHEQEIAFRMSVLEQESEREIDELLRRSLERAAPLLQQLKNVPDPLKETVARLETELRDAMRRAPLGVKRKQFMEGLKKGDRVYIPRYREQCRVLKIRKKEETIEVAYRNLSVKVSMDEVMWPHWY